MTPKELNKKYPLPEGVEWEVTKYSVRICGKLPQDPYRWTYAWASNEVGVYAVWAANPGDGGSPGKLRHKVTTEQEAIDSMYTYFILGDWRNDIRD